jgi:hypothetical protein
MVNKILDFLMACCHNELQYKILKMDETQGTDLRKTGTKELLEELSRRLIDAGWKQLHGQELLDWEAKRNEKHAIAPASW